jgi:hypothetical protein
MKSNKCTWLGKLAANLKNKCKQRTLEIRLFVIVFDFLFDYCKIIRFSLELNFNKILFTLKKTYIHLFFSLRKYLVFFS